LSKKYIITVIILGCSLLLSGCKEKAAEPETSAAGNAAVPALAQESEASPTVEPAKEDKKTINLNFKDFTKTDNTYPENLYEIQAEQIRQTYKTFEYKGLQFMVYDGRDDNLHIGFMRESKYYSLCQIDNWTDSIDRETFENGKNSINFYEYQEVVGTSGVHVVLWNGAASSNDFYISVNDKNENPALLISYCTGGFHEADIDQNKEKELISYGGGLPANFFLIIRKEDKLMWTDYLYYNDQPIFYDDNKNEFFIMEGSDKKVYFDYSMKDGLLTEK
jgi:hypothetical protein